MKINSMTTHTLELDNEELNILRESLTYAYEHDNVPANIDYFCEWFIPLLTEACV